MKYTEMKNDQLLGEIFRVQNLMNSSTNPITRKQNGKYLAKLHAEWQRRRK